VQEDYTIHIVLDALMAIGSPVFFLFMVLKHRTASRWIRCIFVLLAFVGVPWGVLGVLRLGYPTHFTRVTRASFYHFETPWAASPSVFSQACCSAQSFGRSLGDGTAGLTNRWSQPLAGEMTRFDFMKQFLVFATLALASGGSARSR